MQQTMEEQMSERSLGSKRKGSKESKENYKSVLDDVNDSSKG